MQIGARIEISGFLTKDKFVRGRTLAELERLLGYAVGRLSKGVIVAKPRVLPGEADFETRGYSQVAGHHYTPPSGLDFDVIRRNARDSWSMSGPDSLVKLLPIIRHKDGLDLDVQYPPGAGIPQWRVIRKLLGTVVAVVDGYPNGQF